MTKEITYKDLNRLKEEIKSDSNKQTGYLYWGNDIKLYNKMLRKGLIEYQIDRNPKRIDK